MLLSAEVENGIPIYEDTLPLQSGQMLAHVQDGQMMWYIGRMLACLWMAAFVVGPGAAADEGRDRDSPAGCGPYRVATARKLDNLEQILNKTVAEGYHVIGVGAAEALMRHRSLILVLLEKADDSQERLQYAVAAASSRLVPEVNRLAANGYRVMDRNVFSRLLNAPWWGAWMGPGASQQVVIIMQRPADETMHTPTYQYVSEPLRNARKFVRALDLRSREGFRLVQLFGGWRDLGALLERPLEKEGIAPPVSESVSERFRLLTRMKRRKLGEALEAAAAEGYRLLGDSYGTVKGGAHSWLVERVTAPPATYHYRVLPLKQDVDHFDLVDRWRAEGFRVHRAVPGVMERDPDEHGTWTVERVAFDSVEDLPAKLAAACRAGDEILELGPDEVLLERRAGYLED